MKNDRDKPLLTSEEIQTEVLKRLKRYDGFNFLEQFAMYMGIAQIVEIILKQFLHRKYGVDFESLEHRTLGQISKLLEQHDIRADFLSLLNTVVDHRNHIAHELLASQFMLIDLDAGGARFEVRLLEKAIYELEQLWFLFEWTEAHNLWD